MITVDELRKLERDETGCTRRALLALRRLLNDSGSAKAARIDVARIICAYAREKRIEPLEYLHHREQYLDEREQLYRGEIHRARGVTSAAMQSKLRDLQTLRDALADIPRADLERLIAAWQQFMRQ